MSPATSLLLLLVSGICAPADSVGVVDTDFPYLPPLLRFNNGTAVETVAQWENERRTEIKELLGQYLLGTAPSRNPSLLSATEINSTQTGIPGGGTSKFFSLVFERNISFDVEVVIPPPPPSPASPHERDSQNDAAFPVFVTQWNHREWALLGVNRGYVGVVYPGADTRDAAPQFQAAFPNESMALIRARALVASCTLDFILAPPGGAVATFGPHPLNASQICATGHSRNGKQSLIFAAFDERVAAVVGSSPGAPISSPYHFSSHNFYGEGPDAGQAGHWWVEGILNYSSHPERLPMDGHGVLGLIAPRACAVAVGWTDKEGSITFASEMNVLEAAKVYSQLYSDDVSNAWSLNTGGKVQIIHRPGAHHGFDDVNSYFDWFDTQFGRMDTQAFPLGWAGPRMLTEPDPTLHMITPAAFNWTTWEQATGPHPPAPSGQEASTLEDRIRWLIQLDNRSESVVRSAGSSYSEMQAPEFLYTAQMMKRIPNVEAQQQQQDQSSSIEFQTFSFGDYVTGIAYWTNHSSGGGRSPTARVAGTNEVPLRPAVVWLHPYSYATGFTPTYGDDAVHLSLANAGFISVAFDQVGFGTRILEGGTAFYARRGRRASLFGHMVRDVRAAVDVLECLGAPSQRSSPQCGTGETPGPTYPAQEALRNIPGVDPDRIFLAGYSLGGNVALHAAALDARVAGVAAFSAFTPFRTDSNDRPTLGLRRLYDLHGAIPRLGLFSKNISAVPYDYTELIGSLAPRPVLLYTAQDDRDATFGDVAECVTQVSEIWSSKGAAKNFSHIAPEGETSMSAVESKALIDWLQGVVDA